ncbi:hypothetical protein HZU67_05339 [Apis mellifera carnica]|nr:hypothetical protein HZU67_05339 [Apis mellifera carnica]
MIDPSASQDFEEKSIKFFPPAYLQRYIAVADVIDKYHGKLRKIVDFGCAELDFLVYLKNRAGIEEILCVDIDRSLLEASKNKGAPLVSEYLHTRTTPLVVEICEGSVTHNDKKLENTDAVICIELIEHLHSDILLDVPYNIFGYIKPKLAVITTPNADFNVLFPNFSGFRHPDHKFEWTREQFQNWADNIVLRYPDYSVTFDGICKGPEGSEHLGCCTQMAVFHRISEKELCNIGIENLFKTVVKYEYPFRIDNRSDEEKILDEAAYYIRYLSYQNEDMEEEVPLNVLINMLKSFHISTNTLQTILEDGGWTIENHESGPVVLVPPISTFSDDSAVLSEIAQFNDHSDLYSDEDWPREAGPPINSNRFLRQESSDVWSNENWNEESIVIPQNNSIPNNNTYLFDEENILLNNESETTRNTEIFERDNEINDEENLNAISNIDNFNNSFYNASPLRLNESTELPNSIISSLTKFEDVKEDSFFYVVSDAQDDPTSKIVETPPKSWSPEIIDSGYPNSASAQDMTPEYDLPSIAQDHISESESPSIAEAPEVEMLEVIEVENGDLANNNRDDEGNNMIAAELNDLEDLQPLIEVLENDIENENDIYAVENDFPIWLLRILNMANPIDVEIHMRDHRELRFANGVADDARYINIERDEGFDSTSEENSDLENNEMRDNINENALNIENDNENASNSDSGSEQWITGDT